MKNKVLLSVLLLSLLLSMTGTAFAQEPLPPRNSGNTAALSKSESGLSLRAGNIQQPAALDSGELITPLVNGDFEQGALVGWSEYSTHGWPIVVQNIDLPQLPHGGTWAAWLGGDDSDISYISQGNITITNPTSLRLWYWSDSEDDCGFDYGYMLVNNNTTIYSWNLCQSTNTGGWVPLDLNLSTYYGQTIALTLAVITDEAGISNLFLDDISLIELTFADVPYGYWAESYIQRLYNAGVTGGCATSPLMYCPGNAVTRDQMAVFLLRGIHG